MQNMIRVGTFGSNGHQIHQEIAMIQGAALTACCDTPAIENMGNVQIHEHFEDLVANPDIDLISICAPVRAQQGRWIKQALLAGKHVYAEKPCVMTGAELDECLDLANHCGRELLEMSGTAFEEPYATLRQVLQQPAFGDIVQVMVQKSYPMAHWRPQDENTDGGLILQNGIHAIRIIEHVTGLRITGVSAIETGLGNPSTGELRTAASATFTLENGGVASAVINYLNPPGYGSWANERTRIFTTAALLEAGSKSGCIQVFDTVGAQEIPTKERLPYLQQVIDYLAGKSSRPMPVEMEFHPTRVAIAARQSAKQNGNWIPIQ